MSETDGFFPERLVLRQRLARSQAAADAEVPSELAASVFPPQPTPPEKGASPGFSPWMWFVIFLPIWIGGGVGRHFSRGVASALKDSLLRDSLSAGLDALAGLALGLAGLGVYLAFRARVRGDADGY